MMTVVHIVCVGYLFYFSIWTSQSPSLTIVSSHIFVSLHRIFFLHSLIFFFYFEYIRSKEPTKTNFPEHEYFIVLKKNWLNFCLIYLCSFWTLQSHYKHLYTDVSLHSKHWLICIALCWIKLNLSAKSLWI